MKKAEGVRQFDIAGVSCPICRFSAFYKTARGAGVASRFHVSMEEPWGVVPKPCRNSGELRGAKSGGCGAEITGPKTGGFGTVLTPLAR